MPFTASVLRWIAYRMLNCPIVSWNSNSGNCSGRYWPMQYDKCIGQFDNPGIWVFGAFCLDDSWHAWDDACSQTQIYGSIGSIVQLHNHLQYALSNFLILRICYLACLSFKTGPTRPTRCTMIPTGVPTVISEPVWPRWGLMRTKMSLTQLQLCPSFLVSHSITMLKTCAATE